MSSSSLKTLISKSIQQSDERARKLYAADALSLFERYSILMGFLEKISRYLVRLPRLYVLFFPTETNQLFCAYREMGLEHFKIVEMRDHLTSTKQLVQHLASQCPKHRTYSEFSRSCNEANGDLSGWKLIPKIVKSALGHKVTDTFLSEADGLLVCLNVPDARRKTNPKYYQDLTGVLVLLGDSNCINQNEYREFNQTLSKEFENYIENIRRFLGYETGIFISSLADQDARIQESNIRGFDYATYMFQHRFRNFRQAAQHIGEHFHSASDVLANPDSYEKGIRNMSLQLEEALHLEDILRNLAERPEIISQSVEEVKEIFESTFQKIIISKEVAAELVVEVDDSLLTRQIVPPYKLIEEVFLIHLDNGLREIDRKETIDKRLLLKIDEQADNVSFTITNFGPPIPENVLEDLERVVLVRQPQNTGLGVFLSAKILQQVGATMNFISPISNGMGAAVILGFRKYESGGVS